MNKQVELIKAEIEKWLDILYDKLPDGHKVIFEGVTAYEANIIGKYTTLESLLDYINSLQEEPISKDLEEAARRHAEERFRTTRDSQLAMKCKWSFISGAKWLREQQKKLDKIKVEEAMKEAEEPSICDIVDKHYWEMLGEEPVSELDKLRALSDGKPHLGWLADAKEEEELAKAAEEYAYTNCEDDNYHEGASEGMPFDPIGHAKKTFIAGADWQRAYTASKAKSKSFEEQVKELWEEQNTGHDYIVVHSYNIFYGLCLDIANWQKEQIEKQDESAMQYVKEHHSPSEVSDFQAAMNIAVVKAHNAGYTEGYKAGKEECLEPFNKGFEECKKWQSLSKTLETI